MIQPGSSRSEGQSGSMDAGPGNSRSTQNQAEPQGPPGERVRGDNLLLWGGGGKEIKKAHTFNYQNP